MHKETPREGNLPGDFDSIGTGWALEIRVFDLGESMPSVKILLFG